MSEREEEDEREDSSSALARRATMPALAQLERALVSLREGGGKGASGEAGELGFSEAAAAAARERGVVRERYWASLTACWGGEEVAVFKVRGDESTSVHLDAGSRLKPLRRRRSRYPR